jgi:hypothetical protein
MATKTKLKIGDKVRVQIGVEDVEGVILNIYGPSGERYALVRTPILGSSGETLDTTEFTVPEHSLTLAAPQQ